MEYLVEYNFLIEASKEMEENVLSIVPVSEDQTEEERNFNDAIYVDLIEAFKKVLPFGSLERVIFDTYVKLPWPYESFTIVNVPEPPFSFHMEYLEGNPIAVCTVTP